MKEESWEPSGDDPGSTYKTWHYVNDDGEKVATAALNAAYLLQDKTVEHLTKGTQLLNRRKEDRALLYVSNIMVDVGDAFRAAAGNGSGQFDEVTIRKSSA